MRGTSPIPPGTADPAALFPDNSDMAWRMLESMTDAFQVFDAGWRISYMNPVARKFFASHGLDPDSMIGKHFWDDLFPGARNTDSARQMRRAMTERVPVAFENYYEPWDSWQFSRFDPLPDGGLANYYQDITARKRAEEALRKSEARYRSLIGQVRDFAIFSSDEYGVVKTWNEGCQYVLGYAEKEFVGLDTAELFTPEDRAVAVPVAERSQAAEAGTAMIDRWMIAKGGRRFFAMGAVTALRDHGEQLIGFSSVIRDVTKMKVFQDELVGHEESLQRMVTERTGELQETTERLRISERMAALGTLAAGLGHDMGNLLLPMDVRLGLLIEADLPRELHEHVVGIQKCARYLQRLSSSLRLLATDPAHVESRGVTELGRWWSDVRIILKDVLPGGVRFEDYVPESESWVGFGRTGLTQAVYNLVQNAADAIKEHGGSQVSIRIESDPSDPWITIRVADDGPGMPEEVARRCMEPYFSTKARGESTGMGLSLVHALVTGAGGQVEIQSAPGQGTTISLVLPRALPKEHAQDASPDMAGAV